MFKKDNVKRLVAYSFAWFFKIPFSKRFYLLINKRIFNKYSVFSGLTLNIKARKGILLNIELEDWIPKQLFFFNNYEEYELKFIDQTLKSGDIFIDIGANIGLYSLSSSIKVGDKGNVIAFEPFHENYLALKYNVNLNKRSNIIVEKLALSEKEGMLDLFYADFLDNKGMVTTSYNDYEKVDSIQSISLDRYVEINNVENIRYIKIDIEGGEYRALLGMQNVLLNIKPILQIEIDEAILAKVSLRRVDIDEFLDKFGYEEFEPVLNTAVDSKIIKAFSYSKNKFFRSTIQ